MGSFAEAPGNQLMREGNRLLGRQWQVDLHARLELIETEEDQFHQVGLECLAVPSPCQRLVIERPRGSVVVAEEGTLGAEAEESPHATAGEIDGFGRQENEEAAQHERFFDHG